MRKHEVISFTEACKSREKPKLLQGKALVSTELNGIAYILEGINLDYFVSGNFDLMKESKCYTLDKLKEVEIEDYEKIVVYDETKQVIYSFENQEDLKNFLRRC